MLDIIFLTVFSVAVLMTLLTAFDREEIAWPILGFVLWLATAGASATTESVHVMLDSADNVVEHVVTHPNGPFPIMLFFGLAVVFIALFFNRLFEVRRTVG